LEPKFKDSQARDRAAKADAYLRDQERQKEDAELEKQLK
jgi:hypothetical protein